VHYLNPFVFKDSRSPPCWMKGAAEKKDPFSDCITCPKQPCWSSESDEKIRSFTRLPPVRHISWCSLRFLLLFSLRKKNKMRSMFSFFREQNPFHRHLSNGKSNVFAWISSLFVQWCSAHVPEKNLQSKVRRCATTGHPVTKRKCPLLPILSKTSAYPRYDYRC